jgi:hypothetical protein
VEIHGTLIGDYMFEIRKFDRRHNAGLRTAGLIQSILCSATPSGN